MSSHTEEIIASSLAACVKYASGTRPTDPFESQAWEMAGAHSYLLNGLLHIYKTVDSIPPEKHSDFAEYALQWYAALDDHHQWEETSYLPMFGTKIDTNTIVEEHEAFHDGVEQLKDYLLTCIPAGTTWGFGEVSGQTEQKAFDAATFRGIVDSFAEPLAAHLEQELDTLAPAKLRASGVTEAELKQIGVDTARIMRSKPPTTFFVFVVLNVPKGIQFPPAPGFVKNILAPYVFWLPNRRLWQFAPQW